MNQIVEFFKNLFSVDEWPPRWHCGRWTDFHGWLYIISDLTIWAAYFLIPVIILNYFNKKKTSLKFNKAYIYFAAFILLCGATHFFDSMMFWIPMYRINALIRAATAIVSMATVYYLFKILPQAFQQRTNIELEEEIKKRELAEKKLAEANKDLEAFAYIASHDLQEPLRKIRTYSSMLLDDNAINSDHQNLLNKIAKSGERMQTMISDVLTLSTIQGNIELGEVDLNDAVKHALDDLEIKCLEKNAQIKLAEMPKIAGNKAYLSQLFMNLISNALKFSSGHPVISITSEVNEDYILVRVADNGIGIAEEDINKIFGAFQRLHGRNEYEGSGIGLSICKKIIEAHHGSISVTSKLNEGSVFILRFPSIINRESPKKELENHPL